MSVVSPNPKRCCASNAALFSGSFMWGRFILMGVQMAPGEMEEMILPLIKIKDIKGASEITITVEDND